MRHYGHIERGCGSKLTKGYYMYFLHNFPCTYIMYSPINYSYEMGDYISVMHNLCQIHMCINMYINLLLDGGYLWLIALQVLMWDDL